MMLELLLRGGPWEVAPGDMARVIRAARHHVDNAALTSTERERIGRVWLAGEGLTEEQVQQVLDVTGGELLPGSTFNDKAAAVQAAIGWPPARGEA